MTAHRKVLRRAAIETHRLATDIREGRGLPLPSDDPPGYVQAFAQELRAMARLLEGHGGSLTCQQAKDAALATKALTDVPRAHRDAVNALLSIVNDEAQRNGVCPFSG